MQTQTEVFGDELTCAAKDSGVGRLAELQRQWWSVLNFTVEKSADRLTEKLKTSNLFADSCKDDAHKDEFDKITKALSTVMLSSAKGDSWDSTNTRGRFLRCLEQSNLGVTAAEIERGFLDAMNGQYRSYKLFTCDFRPGASTNAETFPGKNQVAIYMTSADEAKGNREWDGSTNNYQNVLFHELMHTTGITDENLVHAAQACCGDPSAQRGNACTKLDTLVAKENRFKVLETYLSRGDVTAIQSSLATTFGFEDGAKVYRSFIEGLDDYQKGTPPNGKYEQGLISGEEYKKCLAKKTETACRSEWSAAIRAYTDVFFSKQCGIAASGANSSNCTNTTNEFKDRMANAFVNAMITSVPSSGNVDCGSQSAVAEAPTKRSSYSLFEIARAVLAPAAHAASGGICIPSIDLPDCSAAPVVCATPSECAPATPIVSATSAGPVEVSPSPIQNQDVQGDHTTDQVTNPNPVTGTVGNGAPVGGGGSGVGSGTVVGGGGGSSGGGRATASPIPVRQVDSVADSRVFADDQYRRATDFVGSATRRFDEARNTILPRAEAGGRSRAGADTRLGLKDDFVAFRPGESKTTSTTLDNPFGDKRSIASITDIGNLKAGTAAAAGGASLPSGSGGVGADASAALGGTEGKLAKAEGASGSSGASGSASNAAGGRNTSSVGGDSGKHAEAGHGKPDLLEGLFTQTYREIEPRLNHLEVVEALISAKISVQDAKGRKFGSNRARETYVFAGFDKPLKKQKD